MITNPTMITNPIIEEVCRRCRSNDLSLRDVSLQSLPLLSISQSDVELIVLALVNNTTVNSLDVTTELSNEPSIALAKALVDMLSSNSTISRISIAFCDQLLGPLLTGIARNRSIKTLSLGEATLQDSLPRMTLTRQWEMALRMNTSLTRLVLQGISVSSCAIQAMGAGFRENQTLHSLEVCQIQLDNILEWARFYEAIGTLSSLRVLHMISCKCSSTEPNDYMRPTELNCLQDLYELRCIDHGDRSIFTFLGQSLSKCHSLRTADFRGNRLTNVECIVEALAQIPCFRKLVLEDNELDCNAVRDLCQFLFQSSSLRFLNLRDNKIGARGAQILASTINACGSYLEVLDISANPVGLQGVAAFGMMLPQNETLTALHMESVGLDCSLEEGQTAVSLLAVGMAKNSSLRTLCLGGNRLGYEGAELIKLGLTLNVSLNKLVLSYCQLGDDGIASLADALRSNHTLEELVVPFNDIGDKGIQAIGRSLPRMYGLARLHLEFNSFSNYEELLRGLEQNMRLESISIMNEHFLFRVQEDPRKKHLEYYLQLNQGGRRILQHDVACEIWPHVLERAFRNGGVDSVFYLLSQKPEMFQALEA